MATWSKSIPPLQGFWNLFFLVRGICLTQKRGVNGSFGGGEENRIVDIKAYVEIQSSKICILSDSITNLAIVL